MWICPLFWWTGRGLGRTVGDFENRRISAYPAVPALRDVRDSSKYHLPCCSHRVRCVVREPPVLRLSGDHRSRPGAEFSPRRFRLCPLMTDGCRDGPFPQDGAWSFRSIPMAGYNHGSALTLWKTTVFPLGISAGRRGPREIARDHRLEAPSRERSVPISNEGPPGRRRSEGRQGVRGEAVLLRHLSQPGVD